MVKINSDVDKLHSFYGVDEGNWMDIGSIRLRVRSIGSSKVSTVKRRIEKVYNFNVPDSIKDDVNLQIYAYGIIVDWGNVEVDGVKQDKYNPKLMYDVLKSYPSLAGEVAVFSMDQSNFQLSEENQEYSGPLIDLDIDSKGDVSAVENIVPEEHVTLEKN